MGGSQDTDKTVRDDDRYWKLGIFYFNKSDPSLFVEKKVWNWLDDKYSATFRLDTTSWGDFNFYFDRCYPLECMFLAFVLSF